MTPGHSSSLPTPFSGLCSAESLGLSPPCTGDPRELSSPAPGLCYSLIWCSRDACYSLIWCSVPWHGDSRQPGGDSSLCPGSFSLWPRSPPVSWLQVNIALRATASKRGASRGGERRPGGIFLSFFPPHPNPQGWGGDDGCEMKRGCLSARLQCSVILCVNGLVLSTQMLIFPLQSVMVSFSKRLSESLSVVALSCLAVFDVITYCHSCCHLFLFLFAYKRSCREGSTI